MNGGAKAGLRLAVIGDPVAHSASPALMRRALADAGIAGTYEALRIPAGSAAAGIDALRAQGYHGLNVTTPLKEEAFARADARDAVARAAGSVNTLVLGARIGGYTTDGAGAVGALCDAGLVTLGGSRILVLGAGPTARAACVALGAAGARVSLWNRTAARAAEVARDLGAGLFEPGAAYDAVLAALPPHATLDQTVRGAVLAAPHFIDANYGERATLGAALGRSDATDGLAMLRHAAAASFEIWRRAWCAGTEVERALQADYGEGEIRTPETF